MPITITNYPQIEAKINHIFGLAYYYPPLQGIHQLRNEFWHLRRCIEMGYTSQQVVERMQWVADSVNHLYHTACSLHTQAHIVSTIPIATLQSPVRQILITNLNTKSASSIPIAMLQNPAHRSSIANNTRMFSPVTTSTSATK